MGRANQAIIDVSIKKAIFENNASIQKGLDDQSQLITSFKAPLENLAKDMRSEISVLERSNYKFIGLYRECLSEKQGKIRKEVKDLKYDRLSAQTGASPEKSSFRRPKTGSRLQAKIHVTDVTMGETRYNSIGDLSKQKRITEHTC